jgi:lipid-A-disaccharide synthase
MVILPFEVDFYRKYNLNVHFVGHPLIDTVKPHLSPTAAREKFNIREQDPLIALLPGSRNIELKLLLPHLVAAAELLYARDSRKQFVLPIANSLEPARIKAITANSSAPIQLVQNATYELVSIADCAVVAAGTATLETALLNTPQIIIGRVSRLTWFLWSRYTRLPYYGLPNYIIEEKIITELIQHQANAERICAEVENLLTSEPARARLYNGYARIRARLGESGASERAAQALTTILAGNRQPYLLKSK